MTAVTDQTPPQPDDAACGGCAEGRRAATTTRRGLLKAALAAGAALTTSTVSTQVAHAAPQAGWIGDTLVVLSLRGGFDGLSAVAPVGDPEHLRLRPGIGLTAGAAIQLDDRFGLHPALGALKPLYDNGSLGVVHAVGMPDPNRSHFAAMEAVERAAPGSSIRTGWLERSLGLRAADGPFDAVQLGSTAAPPSLAGPREEIALEGLDRLRLHGADDAAQRARWARALTALHSGASAPVRGPARSALAAVAQSGRLPAPAPGGYPDSHLGRALRDVARLLRSSAGVRVATVDEGDWDMHAGLGRPDAGWMHDKLTDLAHSLAAFAADLGPLMQRVTLVTMSEFGRRAAENGSGGVDHGWGNAMLLMGGGVVGGRVHGVWPGLAPGDLVQGDLRATTDHRAVLADVLRHRCGATTAAVREVFPGWTGSTLGVTRPR